MELIISVTMSLAVRLTAKQQRGQQAAKVEVAVGVIKYTKPLILSMTLLILSLGWMNVSFGQADSLAAETQPKQPVDVNFLFNYYNQEGENSAVTGGIGTEQLSDIGTQIIINFPVDSTSSATINAGFSHYSSASTDKIDFKMSSASRYDNRGSFQLSYEKALDANNSVGGFVGASVESDYYSNSFGINWTRFSSDGNSSFSAAADVFLDRWIMIFPEELRDVGHLVHTTDKRRTYDLALNYNQVLNRKLQASVNSGITFQKGLLSTPFHRVYFENDSTGIEKLPDTRIKFPLGIRINYFTMDKVILRFFYRFYADSYNISSHTVEVETPFKPNPFIAFIPFYRIYVQNGTTHFKSSGNHNINSEYHTSDYDLSTFTSHKVGIGLRYSPLYGFFHKKNQFESDAVMRSIALRASYYSRTDGLSAFILSTHFSFRF